MGVLTVFLFAFPSPSSSFTCGFLPLSFKLSQICTENPAEVFRVALPHSRAVLKAAGALSKDYCTIPSSS